MEELRQEDLEEEPRLFLVVRDPSGQLVRRVEAPRGAGLHRIAWDLRWPSAEPTALGQAAALLPWETAPRGPLAVPGTYSASLESLIAGQTGTLTEAVDFEVVSLDLSKLGAKDQDAVRSSIGLL